MATSTTNSTLWEQPPDSEQGTDRFKYSLTFPLKGYPSHTTLPEHMCKSVGGNPILTFCAEEVRRQGDTPWHVYRMYEAWHKALSLHSMNRELDHAVIQKIGMMIDELNVMGYRESVVYIGVEARPYETIHADLSELLKDQHTLDPDTWYYRFEVIHPFGDGNGRTGKVLYNWLNGTLDNPVWPRNWWGISNP